MSNFHVLDILDKLGYFQVTSKEENVLYKSIQISLEIIGEPHRSLLVNHLCSLSALSEKELLTNYDIFEKALNLALYKSADIITRSIRKELLPYAVLHDQSITTDNIVDPKFSVKDILSRLRISEILDFVLKAPSHSHIAFIYKHACSKRRIFPAFFEESIANGSVKRLVAERSTANSNNSNKKHYHLQYRNSCHDTNDSSLKILQDQTVSGTKDEAFSKLPNWIVRLHTSNQSQVTATMIASDETMAWMKNYCNYDNGMVEKLLSRRVLNNNVSFLCGYDISKLSDTLLKTIKTIIPFHDYVILDEPFTLYRIGQPEGRKQRSLSCITASHA